MTTIIQTPRNLRKVLDVLSSTKNKIAYLRSIYTPGDTEIVDLVLEFSKTPPSDILEQEIKFALANSDVATVEKYGLILIDEYYIPNDFTSLLPEKLKGWGNANLIQHALATLPTEGTEEKIASTVRFFEGVGITNNTLLLSLKKKLHEYALADTEYPWRRANALKEDGCYAEAIATYISAYKQKKGSRCLEWAWQLACDNHPEMKKELALLVWKEGPAAMDANTYIQSTILLGYQPLGKDKIRNTIRKCKPQSPRFYTDLLVMAKAFGLQESIDKIFNLAHTYVNNNNNYSKNDSYKELAKLYFIINQNEKVKYWYKKCLYYEIEQCSPSHSYSTIKKYEELVGDTSLRILTLPSLEKEGKYEEAAALAREFGQHEKADKYVQLAQIILMSKKV